MTDTTPTTKKTTAKKKVATPQASPSNTSAKAGKSSSFLPFELPKLELPKFDVPKVELPKLDVPSQVTDVAERGRDFLVDSVKSARNAATSVRKNVSETVVLVREAVGV